MKVFYKKKIQERIFDAIKYAEEINKKIDHIDLTKKEADELNDYISLLGVYKTDKCSDLASAQCVYGVKITVDGE